MGETKITRNPDSFQLVLERTFDAPLEQVWKAWTTDEINKWWGPRGWETTSKNMEVTPGGNWLYCMKCVDENQGDWFGQESWGKAVYKQVDAPHKLVWTDYFSDADGTENKDLPATEVVMDFYEEDGKTRVVSTSTFADKESYDKVLEMGVEQGVAETWDRLAEQLVK